MGGGTRQYQEGVMKMAGCNLAHISMCQGTLLVRLGTYRGWRKNEGTNRLLKKGFCAWRTHCVLIDFNLEPYT